jgi:hypothetical protein
VESVLIAVSKPPGNKNRGRLKGDLKKALKDFLRSAALEEITASLYPDQQPKEGKKSRRITKQKIESFIKSNGLAAMANILGISTGRVWQLRDEDCLLEWIIAAGKREKFLGALASARPRKTKRGRRRKPPQLPIASS